MAHDIYLNPVSTSAVSTAPDVFVQAMACEVNQHDVESILQAQKLMLLRFEKTNEMLLNCNALSSARYSSACLEFKRHTQQLLEMKKDLESVFRRIRNIKYKLSTQYPSAFEACSNVYNVLEETPPNDPQPLPEVTENPEPIPETTTKSDVPPSSSCSQTTTPSPVTSPSTSDTG